MSHPFFIPGKLFYTCVITNNTTTDPSEGVIVTARESWSFRKTISPPSVSMGRLKGWLQPKAVSFSL